jgi:predicted transcriptional regulator
MSPRAACRLEALGFEQVYDYVPGKADWLARGLPTEGEPRAARRAVDVLREDVATCRVGERFADVRPRIEDSPYGFALVLSEGGTLLGRIRQTTPESDPNATVEEVMEAGPSTIRADTALEGLRERLDKRGVGTAVVTTPAGVLLGVARRADLD